MDEAFHLGSTVMKMQFNKADIKNLKLMIVLVHLRTVIWADHAEVQKKNAVPAISTAVLWKSDYLGLTTPEKS